MMMEKVKKKVRYIVIFNNLTFFILEKTKKRKVTKEDSREEKDTEAKEDL